MKTITDKHEKFYNYYFDRLHFQKFAVAQVIGNVHYCHYSKDIGGTATMTGGRYRAYGKNYFQKQIDSGRFVYTYTISELSKLPNDKRSA